MSAEMTVGQNQGKDDEVGQTQSFLGKMSAQSYLIYITCHLLCSVVSITDCSSRVCITVQGSFLPLLVVCSYCNTFWIWYHCLSFLSYAAYNCNPSLFQLISLIHHGADSSKSKNGYLLYIQSQYVRGLKVISLHGRGYRVQLSVCGRTQRCANTLFSTIWNNRHHQQRCLCSRQFVCSKCLAILSTSVCQRVVQA